MAIIFGTNSSHPQAADRQLAVLINRGNEVQQKAQVGSWQMGAAQTTGDRRQATGSGLAEMDGVLLVVAGAPLT